MCDIGEAAASPPSSSDPKEDVFVDDDLRGGDDDKPTTVKSGKEVVLFETGGRDDEFLTTTEFLEGEGPNVDCDAGGEGGDAAPSRASGKENHHEPGDGAHSTPEAWRAYCNKEEGIFVKKEKVEGLQKLCAMPRSEILDKEKTIFVTDKVKAKVAGLLKLCAMPRSKNLSTEDDPRWDDVRRFLREATDEEKKAAAEEAMESGRFPLLLACACKPPADVVEALIEASPETVRRGNDAGVTPLHVACVCGASETVVRLLINMGGGEEACLKTENKGWTPLHFACQDGASEEVVRLLIDRGGGKEACSAQDEDGRTPLHFACGHGASEAVVRLLINKGGGKEACMARTVQGSTPLHFACRCGASEKVVSLLIDKGGGKEACMAQTEQGSTPLHFACRHGASEAVVRLLVDGGGNEACLAVDEDGYTPLHCAIQCGASAKVVRLLVDRGGKEACLAQAEKGWTPLHYAIENLAPVEVVRILTDRGEKEACMAQTEDGLTPLHIACDQRQEEEIVRLLIGREGGKEVCLKTDGDGNTPLHIACQWEASEAVVRLLVDRGEKEACMARDKDGWLPLHHACGTKASQQVVHHLIDGGGGKEVCLKTDKDGNTPLHIACQFFASQEVVQLLIERGGGEEVCMAKDNRGNLPLHLACFNGISEENIRLIVQNGGGMSCKTRDTLSGYRFPLYYILGYEANEEDTNEEKISEDTLRLIIKNGGAEPLQDLLDVSQKHREMCLNFEETREALNEGFTRRPVLALMMLDLYFQGFLVAMMSLATKQSLEQNGGVSTWQLLLLVLAVFWRSLRELMQMTSSSYQAYITDFWNWLDMSQIILVSASVAMMNSGRAITTDTPGRILLTVTVGIVWLALLGVMKNFLYAIAVFVTSLQQIAIELIPFLVVTAVTITAFVFMFYSANINASYCEPKDLEEKWYCGMIGQLYAKLSSFMLAGLDIELEIIQESRTTAAILYAFGIIIALIFLNVLIAKINNVFSNVERSGNEVFWRNRLSVVVEAESFLGLLKRIFVAAGVKQRKENGLSRFFFFTDGWTNVRELASSPRNSKWDFSFVDNPIVFVRQELFRVTCRMFVPILVLVFFVLGFASCGVLWPKWMTRWLFFGVEDAGINKLDTVKDKMEQMGERIERKVLELEKSMGERIEKKFAESEDKAENKMNQSEEGIVSRIIELEGRMNQLGERVNQIGEKMTGIENKLDNLLEAVVKLNERSFSV